MSSSDSPIFNAENVIVLCRGAMIALDICKGVSFRNECRILHSKSIIHLDLKSPNVRIWINDHCPVDLKTWHLVVQH